MEPLTEKTLEEVLSQYLLPDEDGFLYTSKGEFFDELTVYTNVIVPGVAKADLTAFADARDLYNAIPDAEKVAISSWLLELGVVLSEPSDRFEGMAGKALPGAAGWNTGITLATLAGADLPTTAVDYTNLVMAGPVATVVPTP